MMKEFCPISLCNVFYKIIARAMTNRLRPLMKLIIDETQSVFVTGRLVSDNIILGFEATNWMWNGKKGKHDYVALKLDMGKTYDRVEWPFLKLLWKGWVLVVDGSAKLCDVFQVWATAFHLIMKLWAVSNQVGAFSKAIPYHHTFFLSVLRAYLLCFHPTEYGA